MPINPDVIGKEYPPFKVHVDASKIREFSASLRDANPQHLDEEAARSGPFGALTAPPTFTRNFWWEGFQVHEDLGFDWERVLHGQQEFEYFKPLKAGAELTVTMKITDSFEKEGRRGGKMTFAVIETTYRDDAGEVVVTGSRTLIETEGVSAQSERPIALERTPYRIRTAEEIEAGSEPEPLVVGPLTRTDFVRYAGASGDFNPIHHDDVYSVRAGNERVFGMGMLAAGYLARLLEEWFGEEQLKRYKVRFSTRVWPGDTLACRVRVTGIRAERGEQLADCECWVENQHGERVINAEAVGLLP